MPMYCYECPDCFHKEEEFQHMRDAALVECPKCGHGNYHRVPTRPHSDMIEFAKPIEMHSIALCHHDDIVEFAKRHPNTEMSTDPNNPLYGVPVACTRKEKLHVLKTEGFRERK